MDNINKYLAPVFEILVRGNFLSQNSSKSEVSRLYGIVQDHFEEFNEYFSALNFKLEPSSESNYYYLSRNDSKYSLEQKLQKFYDYIDILAFFADYHVAFSEGFIFSVSDLEQQSKVNAHLREALKALIPEETALLNKIKKIVKMMTDRGFFECEDDENQEYKVLSAYRYLQDLVNLIDIDKIENEKIFK